MKLLRTSIILGGFISISVFGLFLMPFDGSSHDMACLASLINGSKSPCPQDDPLGFANFHNSAISRISNMTLVEVIAAISFAGFSILILALRKILFSDSKRIAEQFKFSLSTILNTKYRILDTGNFWFSLHENSPAFY